eukprot:evm.model.scf_950.3 EVM.evm.TU.scf_950.3   scf_950:22450-24835(-)
MRRWAAWALLALLGMALLAAPAAAQGDVADEDDYEDDDDRAQLVARKVVKEQLVREGSNMTVVVTVYNAGSSTASNVQLKDEVPKGADLLTGSLTRTFKHITPGSSEQYEYVLVSKAGGVMRLEPTSIEYSPRPGQDELQRAWSTIAHVMVLTTPEYITRYVLMAGQYATFGVVRTSQQWLMLGIVAAVLGLLVGGSWLFKAVSDARDSHKRARAQKALGVDVKAD